MNKSIKKCFSLLAICGLLLASSLVVFAQGTTMISVSNSSMAVGDTTTVSISATESGTVTVKYTASLMNLIDCTASGYSYEGNTITFSGKSGDIKFKAISDGTASIIVSSTACSGSSTTLSIGGSATAQAEPAEQPAPAEAEPETVDEVDIEESAEPAVAVSADSKVGVLNSDGGFDIGGVSYVVSERYSESEIPSGFTKKSVPIGGKNYNELSNGAFTILYLKPADKIEGKGVFYLYDETNGSVVLFERLGSSKNYVVVAASDAAPSPAMVPVSFEVDGREFSGYTFPESTFYYVYGVNSSGVTGWFMYDPDSGVVSRVDTAALTTQATVTESVVDTDESVSDETPVYNPLAVYQSKLEKFRIIVSALIVLCVVLIFVVLNLATKSKSSGSDDDDDDDDFNGDDIFASKPAKKSKKMPRSIVFADPDADGEDEDEEVVADEFPQPRKPVAKAEAKTEPADLDMMDLNDL